MKRLISAVLALVLMFSVCLAIPVSAKPAKTTLPPSGQLDFSKSDVKKGNFKYEYKTIDHVEYCRKVYDDGYSTAYTVGVLFDSLENAKTATEINIVDQIDGIPVTEAGIEYQSYCMDISDYSCYGYIIDKNEERYWMRYYSYSDGELKDTRIGANVEKVTIPESIKRIPAECFANMKKLKTITLPKNLVWLGERAFSNCTSLESVIFKGNKVTKIFQYTFRNCKALKKVDLNKNKIEFIGERAFENCKSLKNINLPSSLSEICAYVFANSGLVSVTIPKNASTRWSFSSGDSWLVGGIFKNCKSLKTVTFLGKEVSLSHDMFWGCDNLKTINFKNANTVQFYTCFNNSINSFSTKRNVLRINVKNKAVANSIAEQLKNDERIYRCKKINIFAGDELACTVKPAVSMPQIDVTPGKGCIKVKYNAVKNATGFQLRVDGNRNDVKKIYKTEKSMTVTLKNLPAGKYKVYLRAFKINGKQVTYSRCNGKTVTVK